MMKKIVISVIFSMVSLIVILANVNPTIEAKTIDAIQSNDNSSTIYTDVLTKWKNEGLIDNVGFNYVVDPLNFIFDEGAYIEENTYQTFLNLEELPNNNVTKVFDFSNSGEISFNLNVDDKALYTISFDFYSINKTIREIDYKILINDEIQYFEASNLTLKNNWISNNEFNIDRYGNDIMPTAEILSSWVHSDVVDVLRLQPEQLRFKLEEGQNKISIRKVSGEFYLGQVYVNGYEDDISYSEYLNIHKNATIIKDEIKTYEAENPFYRNDLGVRFGTDKNAKVTPFSLVENRLNVIDGATFNTSGDAITYKIEVEEAGLYNITLKVKQLKSFSKVFRTIWINNKVPFKEAREIEFNHSNKWQNVTLGNDKQKFLFYLKEGVNTLTIEVNASPLLNVYEDVSYVMDEVNSLDLDIKKLTGNDPSKDRDWDIDQYIPNLALRLKTYAETLKRAYLSLQEINETTKNSQITTNIRTASDALFYFSENPNRIPAELSKFSKGTSSVLQKLGVILPIILDQPLTMDKIYIHTTDVKVPKATANFFTNIWVGIRRFFMSFFDQYDDKPQEDEIEVWVNRSRQYVNLMQQMVDDTFTKDTGIKVKISIMANEDKLILATSSNTQPDVALGVAGWRPYDFAIRNALVDLRQMPDFYEVAERFKPGAFAQLIYQEGVYALPETQNFSLLFYRHDILNTIGIDIPDTWQDVLDILPELQRFGYNFYNRLSSTNAFKAYIDTMPFINQFEGILYTDDLLSANLTHPNTIEAINFMAELYTIYSLPLEVGSFYNEFRYGTLPIGIGDFGMYVQLLNAAPEIAGLWSVAPLPGVRNDEGVVDRTYDGSSTSGIIFKNSEKQDEAWQFLKWWTSNDVQLNYAENLMTSMGPEYMWNTSNVDAFSLMSWDPVHIDIILEQWEWIFDTPKTPASYMMEREISNIWNKVVYDGVNTRIAISDSEIIIDKEITKKMIEFGFINNQNEILKPYLFPTKDNIESWVRE